MPTNLFPLFHQFEGEQVILRSGGVFKQVDIYVYHGKLFAGLSSNSFIRLLEGGKTSKPNTFWEVDTATFRFKIGEFGHAMPA